MDNGEDKGGDGEVVKMGVPKAMEGAMEKQMEWGGWGMEGRCKGGDGGD